MDDQRRIVSAILFCIFVTLGTIYSHAAFADTKNRVVENRVFDQGVITIDMLEPLQLDNVETYLVKLIQIGEDDFQTALSRLTLPGKISCENKLDEVTYYYSLEGDVGLTPLLRDCEPFQTQRTASVQAAVDKVSDLLAGWGIPYVEYFVGRRSDVIRLGACKSEQEQYTNDPEYMQDNITAMLFRYPMGELLYDMNSYVFNPRRKPNKGFRYGHDCGGYVSAVVRDDGVILNLDIIYPVMVEDVAGKVKCIGWQEALNQTILDILSKTERNNYTNCLWIIRKMELTQIADDHMTTHPIWNVEIERLIYNVDSSRDEDLIFSCQIDAVNGEILWPKES